ncbi:MAG: protein kinase [Polyangiaceae bacterium]|nr:protein kinase [Polyangiaceae bacterium]
MIGEGGFGVVYRGLHERFEHPVAIKCLKIPPHFTPDAKAVFLQRFREEGKILLKLADAPGVPRVYDYGVNVGGREIPFLVLEWLDGQTLEGVLEARRATAASGFKPSDAIALLLPAVDAIAIAHEHAIAHRDIKPANLFLATTGRGPVVKVLDFGIAKAMQEGESLAQQQTKTATSFRAFTPNYAAPEQFTPKRFGASGPWTDVHALALVLVELLTAQQANKGEDLVECLESATSPQRPSPRGVTVSSELEAVIQKALALQVADRYANAGLFAAALRSVPEAQHLQGSRTSLPTIPVEDLPPSTVRATPISSSGGTQVIGGGITAVPDVTGPIAMSTEQPVSRTQPGSAGPVVPQAPPRSSARGKKSPLPYAIAALAAVGVAGFTIAAIVKSKDNGGSSASTSSPADTSAPAPSVSAEPEKKTETVLARRVLSAREIIPVLVAGEDVLKSTNHFRLTKEGGRITKIETVDPAGTVRATETIAYPEAGGWSKTVRDGRGVLVETIQMSKAGIETHLNRAGSPFINGCERFAWKFSEAGDPIERTCQTQSGHTIIDAKGCQVIRQEFDAQHLPTSAACFSYDGRPLIDSDGIHIAKNTFDDRGNATESAFFDDKGAGRANMEGCMRVRVEYDAAGNKSELRCIGPTGLTAALRGTKMAYVRNTYDAHGCQTRLEQFDVDGAYATTMGIVGVDTARDEQCGELSRATIDAKGGLVAPIGAPAKIEKTLNAEGLVVEQRCFNAQQLPAHCEGESSPYGSVLRSAYDDKGREISLKAFDANGKATNKARNYPHEAQKTYDERGLLVEIRYLDTEGKPATALEKIAKRVIRHDALGAEISQAGFGIDGAPVVDSTQTHEIRTSYDERHQIARIQVKDATGGPPARVDLVYYGMTWPRTAVRLDVVREDGQVVENKFFDKTEKEIAKVDCRNIETMCVR